METRKTSKARQSHMGNQGRQNLSFLTVLRPELLITALETDVEIILFASFLLYVFIPLFSFIYYACSRNSVSLCRQSPTHYPGGQGFTGAELPLGAGIVL